MQELEILVETPTTGLQGACRGMHRGPPIDLLEVCANFLGVVSSVSLAFVSRGVAGSTSTPTLFRSARAATMTQH